MRRPRLRALLAGTAALLFIAGCSDGTAPLLQVDLDTAQSHASFDHLVSAAAVEGPVLTFLPPLGPEPDRGGTFDPDLDPVVEICEWDTTAGACGETVTVFPGTGPKLRIIVTDDHYQANWHTRDLGAQTGAIYRIQVVVNAAVVGGVTVVLGRNVHSARAIEDGVGLVLGQVVPIRFRLAAGATSPPARSALTGVWTGSYAWDCGGSLTGAVPIRFDLLDDEGLLSGIATYLGGTAKVSGIRSMEPETEEFPQIAFPESPHPAGVYVYLMIADEPASLEHFVYNEFFGVLDSDGIAGTTLNGDSPQFSPITGELLHDGCSALEGPSGTFFITRSPS
jgi:hypothetical protein